MNRIFVLLAIVAMVVVAFGSVVPAYAQDDAMPEFTPQGGTLGDINRFVDFGAANSSSIEWFDWDEQNSHGWEPKPGLYQPTRMARPYSDTGIPIPGQDTGYRRYTLAGTLLEDYPPELMVLVFGSRVTVDLDSTVPGNEYTLEGFAGAYQVNELMVFDIYDGSIMFEDPAFAVGEMCARVQLSIIDYGVASVQNIDVPAGWECTEDMLQYGLFRDPTRHGQEISGAVQSTTVNSTIVDGQTLSEETIPLTQLVAQASTTQLNACEVTPRNGSVNRRRTPVIANDNVVGSLANGTTAMVIGQANGFDGFVWYQTDGGSWIRSDVITAPTSCQIPTVDVEVSQTTTVDTSAPSTSGCPLTGRRDTSNCAQDLNGDNNAMEVPFEAGMRPYGFRVVIGGTTYENCAFESAPAAGYVIDGAVDPTAVHGLSACA